MPDGQSRIVSGLEGIDLAAVVRKVAAGAPAADAAIAFPHDGIAAVHEAGLLDLTVGERYGGRAISLSDLTRLIVALGRGDPSVALIALMTLMNHQQQAQRGDWPEALYRRILSEGRNRPVLINAARVEPDLGSPARGGLPATRARRTAQGWAISGTKRFVTGCDGLAYYLVWASTDETPQRVGTFVVPGGAPGIRIVRNWRSLGMRASVSHDVVFDEVEVGAEDVLRLTDAEVAGQDNRAHAAGALVVTSIYELATRSVQNCTLSFSGGSNRGFSFCDVSHGRLIDYGIRRASSRPRRAPPDRGAGAFGPGAKLPDAPAVA